MSDVTVIGILGLVIFTAIGVLEVLDMKWKAENEKRIEEYRNKFRRY